MNHRNNGIDNLGQNWKQYLHFTVKRNSISIHLTITQLILVILISLALLYLMLQIGQLISAQFFLKNLNSDNITRYKLLDIKINNLGNK